MRYEVQTLAAIGLIAFGLIGCGSSKDIPEIVGTGGTSDVSNSITGDGNGNPSTGGAMPIGGLNTAGMDNATGGSTGGDTGDDTPDAGGMDAMGGMDAGVNGTGGSDAGMGGTGGTMEDDNRPPCLKNATQVIVLGDSYVYWPSHTFPSDLAQAAGNGAVGVWDNPYTLGGRLYAVGGYSMASGGIGLIPPELDTAIAADPDITTIVMTGGGNDILIPDAALAGSSNCKNSTADPPDAVCQQIVQMAMDAATSMMQKAGDNDIKDVIYFFYPNIPENTSLGGTHPNVLLDWAYPQVKQLCDDAPMNTNGQVRCHFVDTRPIFKGHSDWFAAGDIHENSTGSKAIADAVVQVMKDNCIAQPESSGCCAP